MKISGVTIPEDLGNKMILSWDEIREMSVNGIHFGAHTVTHPCLTRLSLEAAAKEIQESKGIIESQLGKEISTLLSQWRRDDISPELTKIWKSLI
jgi:peptidoglycan/xylan/chitin deacetylase (PgdA/CDA1 family)